MMALVNYQSKRLNPEVVINFDHCIVENICLRFPHILEQINELLDNKSLIKCKEVSRTMCSIIENQKSGSFLTKRVIQSYINNSNEFAEEWNIVLKKLPVGKLNVFGILVKKFYKAVPSRTQFQWSPMHIAAERGDMNFCKLIAKLGTIKSYKWSPLYFSAQEGHLEVSKFLYKKFGDKQNFHGSAQHLAAKNGHLEIYKFLFEKSNDINPIMQELITPLHLAAQYGHFDLCKFICDNNNDQYPNPLRSDWNTPLTLAVHRGHFKIARLIHKKDRPKVRIALILCFIYMTCSIIYFIIALFERETYRLLFLCILIVMICWYTAVLTAIVRTILNDRRFCRRTSPKLDF